MTMHLIDEEFALITAWQRAVQAYRGLPAEERAAGGSFSSSGSQELDHSVASILLTAVQDELPSWGYVDPDTQEAVITREKTLPLLRAVAYQPRRLFTINWADSGPGFSWPEDYWAVHVPGLRLVCFTASVDSDENYGYTDLAIGFTRSRTLSIRGAQTAILKWWCAHRACEQGPWDDVLGRGLIRAAEARRWRKAVWGTRRVEDALDC